MRSIKFHQNFKLDRNRLALLIRTISEQTSTTKKTAAVAMGIGEPAVEGCIGWLVKTGLGIIQEKTYKLTPFGALVVAHDPHLNQPETLWLLHYYLVTEHDERAEVWYRAFNEFLNPGISFTRDALQTYVERSLDMSPNNKTGISDDCKEFLKSYLVQEGLGKLNLIHELDKGVYETQTVSLPHPQIFAFTLFDTWQRHFSHTDTLRVTQIQQESEMPGRVFVMRRDQLLQALQSLQSMGLVNIVDSQHEPVTRRFRDSPYQLIETLYKSL